MCAHAAHTVHAVPDLRITAGRLRDGFYHPLLFATADLRLLFCARSKLIFEVRIIDFDASPTTSTHCFGSVLLILCSWIIQTP